MEFSLSEEQEALRQSVAAMLTKQSPLDVVRSVGDSETGMHHELWRTVTSLGLTGLAVDEQYGGAGAGLVELCVVQEQLGVHLGPIPYWSTVLAGLVVSRNGSDELRDRFLPGITEKGTVIAASLPVAGSAVVVDETGGAPTVSGDLGPIADGLVADAVLIPARRGDDDVLAIVEIGEDVVRTRVPSLDPTRAFATVAVSDAPAHVVEGADHGEVRALAAVLLAAEQVGAARAALDMSVAYAGIRQQFGHPIGSYQSIKHTCADMFVAVESAWSATYFAAWTGDHEPAQFPEAATVARLVASDGARFATGANIQVHGGIGFTWEHDAHLFTKRAKASSLLLGDARAELDGVATALLATDRAERRPAWT